jgi:hypothetical protein
MIILDACGASARCADWIASHRARYTIVRASHDSMIRMHDFPAWVESAPQNCLNSRKSDRETYVINKMIICTIDQKPSDSEERGREYFDAALVDRIKEFVRSVLESLISIFN